MRPQCALMDSNPKGEAIWMQLAGSWQPPPLESEGKQRSQRMELMVILLFETFCVRLCS
jgi:hypothetical protein